MFRFLSRLWRTCAEAADELEAAEPPGPGEGYADDERVLRKAHWAIDKVSADSGGGHFGFNTAIAAVMELLNELTREKRGDASPGAVRFALATAASLIFPFAPHAGTDAFHRLTGRRVWEEPWPTADDGVPDEHDVRARRSRSTASRAPAGASRPTRRRTSCSHRPASTRNVQSHVDGKQTVKEIVVPGKLVNLVVR
jgi:leucyl-tRNA synthetase